MQLKTWVTGLFIMTLGICPLFCQDYEVNFDNISTNNGLIDNNIHCIYQDSDGFMWFGSEEGLHQYDGYSIKVFRNEPGENNGLSNNFVRALYEDPYGRLWIGTDGGGITIYDLHTQTFKYLRYNASDINNSLLSDEVYCFAGSSDGKLWVGTTAGMSLLEIAPRSNETTDLVTHYEHFKHNPNDPESLPHPHVYSLLEDSNSTLWIGTAEGGLSKRPKDSNNFINYKPDAKSKGNISGYGIMTIYEDSRGNIWFGTWAKGLNRYNKETDDFTSYRHCAKDTTSISHDNIYSICEDHLGNIWLATYDGGLNKLINDPQKGIYFERYMTQPNELKSFFKNKVKVIYADRTGTMWAGTLGNGVNKIYQTPKNFFHLEKSSEAGKQLLHPQVNAIVNLSPDTMLICSPNGLQQMVVNMSQSTPAFDLKTLLNDSTCTPNLYKKNITTIYRDDQDALWVGTADQGVLRFEIEGNKLKSCTQYNPYKAYPNKLLGREVKTIFKWNNDLWVATKSGINLYDSSKRQFIWEKPNGERLVGIKDQVTCVHIDKAKRLWVGTKYNGALAFENKTTTPDSIRRLLNYKSDLSPVQLSSDHIYSINDGDDGNIWIGTDKGLHLINPKNHLNKCFKEKDGLPVPAVTQIFKDNKGYFWFGTLQGLARFDPVNNVFSSFYMPGGFLSNFFTPGNVKLVNDKMAFLPSSNGIWMFYPDSIKRNQYLGKPVITDFRISGQKVEPHQKINNHIILNESLSHVKEIVLRHNENVLHFEFSALSYFEQKKNKFAYKLEGLEAKWNNTDANHRSVTYSNLSPKEYTLRVKASNNDGVWNPQETTLKIIIRPPYYLTWWAYMIYGILAITSFLLIQRFTVHRVRLREKLKQERLAREKETALNQMKIRFFTNVSHEFRTPLTLISGPLHEILENEQQCPTSIKPQLDMMHRNVDRLLRLINQLMDFRKLMQGDMKLHVSRNDLAAFIQRVADSFMGIAAQKHIHFERTVENQYVQAWFDQEKVETIVFNLLSNAFKYTPAGGKISLSLTTENGRAIITVQDNGTGIPTEDKEKVFERFYQVEQHQELGEAGTGVGLSLVRDFTELHKGGVKEIGKENEGACFRAEIGIDKALFKEKQIMESEEEETLSTESKETIDTPVKKETKPAVSDKKPLILIIEDQPDVRSYLTSILQKHYNIETACNGKEGLEKATANMPTLIISDVMMPEMDGFMLCSKIKKNVITSHIPIIMLTALDGVDSRVESMDSGADAYIIKPFEKKIMLHQIHNLIESRKQLKERFKEQWDFVEEIATTSADKQFVNRAVQLVEEQMGDANFNVSEMVKKMGVSRTLLHMKLKELTGQSTSEFIRTIRLKQAAKLLKKGELNVSEVTYAVGFNDPKYFSKSFKNLFGITPTQFQKGDASLHGVSLNEIESDVDKVV